MTSEGSTPEALDTTIKSEIAKWSKGGSRMLTSAPRTSAPVSESAWLHFLFEQNPI